MYVLVVRYLPGKCAPDWMKESTRDGVMFRINNPDKSPEDQHDNWLKHKQDTGWIYGPEKNTDRKTHPMMLPYKDVPQYEQNKDKIITSMERF